MQQIILFLIKYKTDLVFILLLILAFKLTFQAHTYHNNKFISSANYITGHVLETSEHIDQYFDLKLQNEKLLEENKALRYQLFNNFNPEDTLIEDMDFITDTLYKIKKTTVISNYYDKIDNYLLIKGGEKEGIKEDFGVISSKGIIGIVVDTSEDYARVISILNTNTSINAKLKKTYHFGTLSWDGKDPNRMSLIDVPRSAPVEVGDTITTGGRSLIFPEDIPIGVISDFELDQNAGYYTISVSLFNDMTNLKGVYVIEHTKKEEAYQLLNPELQ